MTKLRKSPNNNIIFNFSSMFLLIFLIKFRNIATLQLSTGWKQLQTNNSSSKDINLPGPRSGSSVWLDKNHQAFLFGGTGLNTSDDNQTQLYADLWSYNIQNGQWQVRVNDQLNCTDNCAIGRQFSAICGITSGNVVVFGGQISKEATDQMLIWNTSSLLGQWQTKLCVSSKKNVCPSARYDPLVWCTEEKGGGHMTIVGGRNSKGRLLNDSWKLDLQRLSWTKLTPPATGCLWMTPNDPPISNSSTTQELPQLALMWSPQNGKGGYIMCYHRQPKRGHGKGNYSITDDEDTNVQLWTRDTFNETWRLVTESGKDSMTWPGGHIHGDTCTDTRGNLWLFGGQSLIGSSGYLNNDVWAFNVSNKMWLKVELPPEDTTEPSQRQRSASWCHQDSMFIYGGSSCENTNDMMSECIQDDLWILNTSVARWNDNFFPSQTRSRLVFISEQPSVTLTPSTTPVSSSSSSSLSSRETTITRMTATTKMTPTTKMTTTTTIIPKMTKTKAPIKGTVPMPLLNGSTGASLKLDSVRHRDLENSQVTISRQDHILSAEGSSDHGTYGSIIFFGISLSIFAAFGVVLFFRRCVSCPPRENILLKEAPPVRYTVIPDESYTI